MPTDVDRQSDSESRVRQDLAAEHLEGSGMAGKRRRAVEPQQARRQTVATLRHLRDQAIHMAKDSLAAGEWRVALTCLWKAVRYDDQATTLDGEGPTSASVR